MNPTKRQKVSPSPGYLIFEILYPLFIYYFTTVAVMIIAKTYVGNSDENYMLCQIIVGVVTLPVMYFSFYKKDLQLWPQLYMGRFDKDGNAREYTPKEIGKDLLLTLAAALTIGTAINNLICMSPLVEASSGYAQANAGFYGSTLLIELIGSGILTPVLEEMTFRGILYGRVRRMMGWKVAVLFTSLLFAAVHFNLVQFTYAFFLGLLFGILLEKTGRLYSCIAAHMALNILAVLRTELGWLAFSVDGSLTAWIFSLILLAAGSLLVWGWYKVNLVRSVP